MKEENIRITGDIQFYIPEWMIWVLIIFLALGTINYALKAYKIWLEIKTKNK